MSPVRILVLVVAAVAAIGLAFVLRGVLAGKDKPSAAPAAAQAAIPQRPMARVLVAKRDLPVGTRIAEEDLDWQDWPADALNATMITDGVAPAAPKKKGAVAKVAQAAGDTLGGSAAKQALEGAVVREPIAALEPISSRKIVRGGEGGYLSVVLGPGMRAIAVSVNVDTAAGGFILPGDRVDVLQSRESDGVSITRTVMRNIRVLAVDQASTPAKDANSIVGAVATLEVTAEDAETLAGAQVQAKGGGGLVLVLRSFADAGGPSGRAYNENRAISVYRAGEGSEVMVSR